MKKVIISIVLFTILLTGETTAQLSFVDLPAHSVVMPYRLEVGYNTTTVIVFPAPLIPSADRGNKEIIVQKEHQVENVLKVKAAKKDFTSTNLHVYTTDGKIYVFDVYYTERPERTTFNLMISDERTTQSPIKIDNSIIDETRYMKLARKIREARNFFCKKKNRYGLILHLRTIHQEDSRLFFGFAVYNHSNLALDIDFMRLYLRDQRKVKRSSVQEQEIKPVFMDDLRVISGKDEVRFVVVVPGFTIPDKKEFVIELYEKNGGRNITLKVKNKHLLRAKSL